MKPEIRLQQPGSLFPLNQFTHSPYVKRKLAMAENLITSQVHKIFTLKALLPLLTFAGGGSSILSGELLSLLS